MYPTPPPLTVGDRHELPGNQFLCRLAQDVGRDDENDDSKPSSIVRARATAFFERLLSLKLLHPKKRLIDDIGNFWIGKTVSYVQVLLETSQEEEMHQEPRQGRFQIDFFLCRSNFYGCPDAGERKPIAVDRGGVDNIRKSCLFDFIPPRQ